MKAFNFIFVWIHFFEKFRARYSRHSSRRLLTLWGLWNIFFAYTVTILIIRVRFLLVHYLHSLHSLFTVLDIGAFHCSVFISPFSGIIKYRCKISQTKNQVLPQRLWYTERRLCLSLWCDARQDITCDTIS